MVAKRAFLHHSFCPDGNISIERTFHLLRPFRRIPVEILYSIGTGRGTVSAPDAAVIDLCHQSLFVNIGSVDRTDFGARWIIAMHTGSWEKPGFDMGKFPFNIRDEFNPVDGAAFGRFFWSDDGDIVFRLAGDDTGLTSAALVQINYHSPSRHVLPPN
jgi:hypothetical protein